MDHEITKLEWTVEDDPQCITNPLSCSPRSQFLALGGLFGFTCNYARSPLDEPQVLSQSLTFNALEEVDCNEALQPQQKPNNICSGLDCNNPRLRLNGKSYNCCHTFNNGDMSSLFKFDSVDTLCTTESHVDLDEQQNSLQICAETRTGLTLNAVHLNGDVGTNDEILIEQGNRRMVSVSLRRFNSFSAIVKLPSAKQANCNTDKRMGKKINKHSGYSTSKSDKCRTAVRPPRSKTRKPINASSNNIDHNLIINKVGNFDYEPNDAFVHYESIEGLGVVCDEHEVDDGRDN